MRHVLHDALVQPAATLGHRRRHRGNYARVWRIAPFMLAISLSQWMAAAEAAAPPKQAIAITDVTVIDVRQDRVSRPRTVVVEDGLITAIVGSQSDEIPAGAQRLD